MHDAAGLGHDPRAGLGVDRRGRVEIPGAQRGVGYLLAEGERPIRMRGFYLDDDDVTAIAERAAARRADKWLAEGVSA